MEMESISNKNLLFSCWGRLKLKLPWQKRSSADHRRSRKNSAKSLLTRPNLECKSIATTLSVPQPKPIANFRYDPLSYSQNFDDGSWPTDGDAPARGFSTCYAVPSPSSPPATRERPAPMS